MITPPSFYRIADPDSITNLVRDHIGTTSEWATEAFIDANTYLNTLADLRFDVPYTEPVINPVSGPSVSPVKPNALSIEDIEVGAVEFTTAPPEVPITFDLVTHTAPEFTEKNYGISIPDAPIVTWPEFSKEAPSMPDRVLPVVPVADLPPIPTITDVTIPSPPEYNNPEFTAEVPVADLTLPVVDFNWGESVYTSDLKTKLGDTLYNNLVSGGSGLDEATEEAIYTRATSRMEEEEQKLVDESSSDIAERGFDIPPGALVTVISENENKILRSRTDLNKDILIQQSNLAQTNTHFIIQHAINLESVLIKYHDNTQMRALDAAKTTITVAIESHKLKLENYKAKLGAYQILAQVFGIKVQAEIAKAEFYKQQIEAAKLSVDVQQLYIQAYLGQLEAVKMTLETYRLQMEGANIAASIDKLKLDGYAVEANTYGIRVKAAAERYEGYKAQLTGESIKVGMQQTDVNSFAAQSNAYHVKTQAEVAKSEAELNLIRMHAAVYEQAISKYKADVGKVVSEAEVKARIAGLDVAVYTAEANNYNSELNAAVGIFRGRIEEMRAGADVSMKSADLAIRATLGEYELAVEVAKGVTQVAGQLAASAAGAVNASLHASSSESKSDSYGKNLSVAYNLSGSESDSFIEEHIYSYSN